MRRIIANHAHVFPEWSRPAGTIGELLKLMDACGIEKCVTFAPFTGNIDQCGFKPNDWLANEIKGNPRLIPFGTIDMCLTKPEEDFYRILELGFPGIKMHPAFQDFNVLCDRARRIYRLCEQHHIFLSFHTGVHRNRIKDSSLLLFDELSFDYPELCFSMEHLGGYSFFNEAVAVMTNVRKNADNPRLYGGLTSVFLPSDTNWYMDEKRMSDFFTLCGYKAAIFGLDFPYKKTEYIQKAIARIESLDIPEEAKDGILGGNLLRALHME